MFVHLFPSQWLTVLSVLGDSLPQVQARIREACDVAGTEDVVAVEGKVEGWRAVADRLAGNEQTEAVANLVQMMATAAETRW